MWHCMGCAKHHEGICLDAAWGSGLEGLRPVLSETGMAAEGGLRGPEASGAAPHSTTPPPSQVDPLDRCERGELGGVRENEGAPQPNFTTPSHTIRESCTSHLKKHSQQFSLTVHDRALLPATFLLEAESTVTRSVVNKGSIKPKGNEPVREVLTQLAKGTQW